eukprot:2037324-Rhodomonas_salina.3
MICTTGGPVVTVPSESQATVVGIGQCMLRDSSACLARYQVWSPGGVGAYGCIIVLVLLLVVAAGIPQATGPATRYPFNRPGTRVVLSIL